MKTTTAAIHVHVHHHDMEQHARSFNEGYETAMAQHLAPDMGTATDWLEEQKLKARTEGMRCVLEAAAQDAAGVIASGDVAECAAFVSGETGRTEAISGRDNLYEDPAGWLRDYAAQFKPDEFAAWHDEHPEQCPPCHPNFAYDYLQAFEESE
jgi:hypothetical protein